MSDFRAQKRMCPACGEDNSGGPRSAYSWRGWVLRQCGRCRFVFLENAPDYEGLAADFPWETNHGDRRRRMEAEHPVVARISKTWRVVRRVLPKGPDKVGRRLARWFPDGPVVDVGCGDGSVLARLPDRFAPLGIEISAELTRRARERLSDRNVTILNMSALEGLGSLPGGSLAGVVMLSLLEHERRPAELLDAATRAIAPGGAMLIKVPNYGCLNRRVLGRRWCGFHFPGHVNHFTPRTLRRMVEAAGFNIVEFRWSDRFWLSDTMWMVARLD